MSLHTAINRFRYIYRTSTVSPPRFLSSSYSYSSLSSSNAKDYPTGDFNFEPLTGFNKFLVRLKTMVALPLERVQYGSVLKINLQGRISEQLTTILCNSKILSLPEICDNFLKAAYDPRISAVYLHIHPLDCGWAKLDEIRRQISNFKKSGKMVVAYVPSIEPKEYYLACASDEIFAPPNGYVGFSIDDLSYLSVDRGYDYGLYDNARYDNNLYGNPDYINFYHYAEDNGEARDSSETRLRDSSEAHTALLHNIYSNWLDKVSSSRGKKREEVQNFINEGVYRLDKLKQEGFISGLVYDDEVITLLKERLGVKVKSLPMISFRKYSKVRKWTVGISEAKEQIAIIRVSGNMDSDIVTSNFIEKIGLTV
jgi:protease IV